MVLTIAFFISIFLLIASVGLVFFNRGSMVERITDVINPRPKRQRSLKRAIRQTGFSLGGMVEHLEQVLPKSQKEVSIVQQRMVRAGYRNQPAVKIFYGCKVLAPVLLCVIVTVTGLSKMSPFFIYVAALGIGYLMPEFWLGRKIKMRQENIMRGLPDVLDLLVICMEAGLGLDQATARTAEELTRAQPELCDELGVVVLEQRAGRPRSEAWRNLADRTGVDAVRNLVSMLVQAEQLGTSVARTLRIQSDTVRTQRIQQVEEKAAKTSVKLVFPLVFFIFPSLFLVTLGPAAIRMSEAFKSIINR